MTKTVQRSKWREDQGFSLIELIVVLTVLSVLFVIAGIAGKQYMDRYKAEGQIRMMHADLMQTRAKAMAENKPYFVAVNAGSYQISADTNENGVADDAWQTPKILNYPVSLGTGTIIMDQRGLISAGTSTIRFSTGSDTPEYDCIQLYATRINIGRMNGADCVPR